MALNKLTEDGAYVNLEKVTEVRSRFTSFLVQYWLKFL